MTFDEDGNKILDETDLAVLKVAALEDGEEIEISGINFVRKERLLIAKDMRFINRSLPDDYFYTKKEDYAGLYCSCFFPSSSDVFLIDRSGYLIDTISGEHCIRRTFPKNIKINDLYKFINIVKKFEGICSMYSNYNYYDVCIDLERPQSTLETIDTPIQEIVNEDNINERMYYYNDGTIIVKIGNIIRKNLNENESIECVNKEHFVDFTKESFNFCKQHKINLKKYIESGNGNTQRWILMETIGWYLNITANPNWISQMWSPCSKLFSFLIHYDNKKTMLITRNSETEKYFSILVKLDKDLQTAKEFRQWIEHNVKPYCQEHKTDYVGFVDELNKQYDERHKNKLIAKELNQLENDKQLDILAGMPNNRENEGIQ